MADGPRRGWMAGVWTVCVALALPALIPAWVAAQDRPRTDPQPGSSPIDIDRAWSAARERDATNIVSIISGAQIPATPTSNVPETLAALPSVSVERVLGEGRYVRVRGLQP